MLDTAERVRPRGAGGQFGRFPGADYTERPSTREVQLAAPLLSERTTYVIPPGPYRDNARGPLQNPRMDPSGRQGQQPPRSGSQS